MVKRFKFYCNKEYTEDYYGEDVWGKGLKKITLLGKKIPDHVRSIEIKTDIQDPENLKKIDFNKVESLQFSYMFSDVHPKFQLENLVGAKFPNVKFFSVFCSSLKNLSPLKKISLPSLEELDFSKNGIQDISVFKHLSFPKLKKLSLACCDIKDITPLLSFSAPLLEEINFCRNEGLSVSLEDAEKLKKQFPLLKKIVILRTINENNWVYITFQEKAVFSNKE
ncbi:leucine Rich repeats (2 copies) [Holospora elegans E1]|uniref:Leucine Rich repeats (2 copies) n=1 Tax=Holospora elegans E1 TaxID=1427503 RepID=A0A023E0P5_9PROT|nr:leucine-rich repeat domain-containing protein [Holospora elegans]GAJ46632.1 leucine Rich repeats (2 copies) [Holospora elegans E1]